MQIGFGFVPDFVRADALFRTGRERELHFVETEVVVNLVHHLADALDFLANLAAGAENMAIVLDEAAHPHQPVQRAGRLIAVANAKFGVAHRQFAVAAQSLVENLDVPGAVHRLDGVVVFVNAAGEHIAAELVPVAGFFPQRAVQNLRPLYFLIAVFAQFAAHIVLDFAVDDPALRVPENHARRFFLQMEEIELFTDAAVVAFFRFCLLLQVSVQRLLVGEGNAVDALQRFAARVAAPVGAGKFGQFERLDVPHVRYVRPATHVEVFLMVIQADFLDAVVEVVNQAEFEIFVAVTERLARVRHRRPHLLHRIAGRCQIFHARFQLLQIFRREAVFAVDVIVEAVFNHRPDDHFCLRPELLQRMTEQVRGGVANDVHPRIFLSGDDGNAGVGGNRVAQVALNAINAHGKRRLGETAADTSGDVPPAGRVFILTDAAVGQSDV